MPYIIRDTGTSQVTACQQLDDAIRMVGVALSEEEFRGRIVDRDREGRWAIYDGYLVKTLWIETAGGSVISFARHRRQLAATNNTRAHAPARTSQPVQAGA